MNINNHYNTVCFWSGKVPFSSRQPNFISLLLKLHLLEDILVQTLFMLKSTRISIHGTSEILLSEKYAFFLQCTPCCYTVRQSNEVTEHKVSCCLQDICYYKYSKVSIVSIEDRCPLLTFTATIFLLYWWCFTQHPLSFLRDSK